MKKLTALILILMLLVCSVAPASAADEPTANIVSASLSLEDNVYIWFDMTLSGAEFASSDYGMIFWTAEQTEYTYEKAEASSEAVIRAKDKGSISHDNELKCDVASFKYGVAAKQMTDVIRAQAYVKTSSGYTYSEVTPYSVQKYAADKLGLTPGVTGTTDEKLKTLLRDMLDYGASAQIYFNYKTDDLANAILNAPVITEPTIMVNSTTAKVGDPTVTVTISLLNNPGISSLRFDISYDNVLTLDTVSFDEAYGYVTAPSPYSNPQKITFISPLANVDTSGTFATLTFNVSETATADTVASITITPCQSEIYDVNFDEVVFDVINGTISFQTN